MADTKISALTLGDPAQATDAIPVARAGTDVRVSAGSVAALAPPSVGANSTPGKINGIVEAGNYPPLTPYGSSTFDICPALITAPPSDSRSVAGLSVGLAAQNLPTENLFALVTEATTPSAYTGNCHAFSGAYCEVDHNGSGTLANAYGIQSSVFNNGSGIITNAYGISFSSLNAGSGTIGNNLGVYVRTGATSGTVTSDFSIEIDSPWTGGTFTNPHVGLHIDDQTAGGVLPNAYAIQVVKGKIDLGKSEALIGTPASAPPDPDLSNGQISLYLDEAGNNLKVRVKYSNGTLKTATVALV